MKNFLSTKLSLAGLILMIGGCSTSNLAEQHLRLISDGKAGEAQSQYCALQDNLRIRTVDSYELKSESEIENGTEYIYSVDSPDVDGEVIIRVVNSDAFFDKSMISSANINKVIEDSSKLLDPDQTPELLPVPKREDYNQDELCIFLPFDQFDE